MDKKQHTPGRRGRTETQYFDIGKVGRKTGITLKDTGVRDEHGMEPVSGIFSSPVKSPEKSAYIGVSHLQQKSAYAANTSSSPRKTPRLPPPRSSTPKHTHIGSPKRMSSTRPSSCGQSLAAQDDSTPAPEPAHPPPNRVLDFVPNGVRKSIESPFRPRRVLRRSTTPTVQDPFSAVPEEPEPEPVAYTRSPAISTVDQAAEEIEDEGMELPNDTKPMDDSYLMINHEDEDVSDPLHVSTAEEIDEAITEAEAFLASSSSKKKPGRPRKSGGSVNTSVIQHTPPVAQMIPSSSGSRKRDRSSLDVLEEAEQSPSRIVTDEAKPAQKKRRGRPSKSRLSLHQDAEDSAIDPALLGDTNSVIVSQDQEPEPEAELEPEPEAVSELAPVASSSRQSKKAGNRKTIAFADRDPNTSLNSRTSTSPVKFNNSGVRQTKRAGSVDNFSRRMSTPFEDAAKTTRSGRPIMKPLKYWAGEAYVWKNGEVDGIIRADEADGPKKKKKKKRRGAKGKGDQLDGADEDESETESVVPDDWEQELGVLNGEVGTWNQELGQISSEGTVREDIAFASTALLTKEVAGSAFTYAKITTLPFFGAGLVELPPEGFKRSKNSRKMQMVFFVHEGKVQVSVGRPAPDGRNGEDMNEFSLTKGGVWMVPRGNNYAITNPSRTHTARVFFAQGCEVPEGSS